MSHDDAPPGQGHLAYYKEHGISPVRYDLHDLRAHFDRRDALYRGLGLPPTAFKGCDILEVAPGSGQNSLYIATAAPALYDLVEPNPTAVKEITDLYAGVSLSHTAPRLHPVRLEEFNPARRYDIIACENWLGSLPHERALIRKLAGLLSAGGTMVLTIVPFTGFFPNVMRKLLALRLVDHRSSFTEQTECLTGIFGPHLATMPNMTRSHQDWVQDCLLNPHYLNVALPLDTVLDEIGDTTEILSSVPRFVSDWRWFKGLVGEKRSFNEAFRRNYQENLHNFIDHRHVFAPRSAAENAPLERLCRELHAAALAWQAGHREDNRVGDSAAARILQAVTELADDLARVDKDLGKALAEVRDIWSAPRLDPERVKAMRYFGPLFGRETIYVSFTATR